MKFQIGQRVVVRGAIGEITKGWQPARYPCPLYTVEFQNGEKVQPTTWDKDGTPAWAETMLNTTRSLAIHKERTYGAALARARALATDPHEDWCA